MRITKERLQEYTWIKENIQSLEDRLLEIDTQLTKTTQQLTQDRVSTTKDNDKWTNLIHERIETENKINRQIEKGLKEMNFIEEVIEKLPEREKYLMRLRYIEGERWESICVKMSYSWRQIHRIHSDVLKKLEKEALFGTTKR